MISYLITALVALLASGLSFFSGFGLGTLLLPALATTFPAATAVAATAVVNLANNLWKLFLLQRHIDLKTGLTFGFTAVPGAAIGAGLLIYMAGLPKLYGYSLWGTQFTVDGAKALIALLILVFAFIELSPVLKKIDLPSRWIPVGGFMSGLFGGLSGHQGAIRSVFLARTAHNSQEFVATRALCATMVDVARLAVYIGFAGGVSLLSLPGRGHRLLLTAIACAFVGSFIGTKLIAKTTLGTVRKLVGWALVMLSIALGAGWI